MIKYNRVEIKRLYDSIDTHLKDEEKEIIKQIINQYNKLFVYAREKKEYIDRNKKQYIEESNENDRLIMLNRKLEQKVSVLKTRINTLKKQIKELKSNNIDTSNK